MPKNETGEFELVLGNRQLLSGFAIVAILFGIFFALGYVIGRNSAPSARVAAAETQPPAVAATPSDLGRPTSTPTPAPPPADANPAPAATQPAPQSGSEAPSQPTTQAARETPAPPPAPKPTENQPVRAVAEPQPGTYLQVMAIKKMDAEVIVKALQAKGFPALMTPSPIEGIFRVLVGPYKDSTSVGNAKGELENSGFHPIVQRIAEKG